MLFFYINQPKKFNTFHIFLLKVIFFTQALTMACGRATNTSSVQTNMACSLMLAMLASVALTGRLRTPTRQRLILVNIHT